MEKVLVDISDIDIQALLIIIINSAFLMLIFSIWRPVLRQIYQRRDIWNSFLVIIKTDIIPMIQKSNYILGKGVPYMGIQKFSDSLVEFMKKMVKEDMKIDACDVTKLNDTKLHAITITREGRRISSNIYIDEYYEAFLNGRSLEDIANRIMKVYYESDISMSIDIDNITEFVNFDAVKVKVVLKLVSKNRNEEYLLNKCYKDFCDLAILFQIELQDSEAGSMTVAVTKDIFKNWRISLDELYDIAYNNTFACHPEVISSLSDVVRELKPELFDDDFAQFMNPPEFEVDMYVLSVRKKINGATCILNTDILKRICEERGFEEICILPSSIHEVLIVNRKPDTDIESLNQMVCQVNETEVSRDEVLSDHIYLYNLNHNKVYF